MPPNQARRRGQTASSAPRPGTLSSPRRISHAVPRLTMRLPVTEYVASLAWFRRLLPRPLDHTPRAACTAGRASSGWRSIGRSPTAISVKNNGGGHRRGRPILVGRAMTVTDTAAALFFRAVARDRHSTHASTACRTLRGHENDLALLDSDSWGHARSTARGHPRREQPRDRQQRGRGQKDSGI